MGTAPPPLLQVRGVSKAFGAETALDGVDLDVARGAVTALLGANGAGKSTLVSIIAGALAPDHGQIVLDGRPVAFGSPAEARRAGVSIVSQELTVFPQLHVEENLLLSDPRFTVRRPRGRRRARADAEAALERLGLGVALGTSVAELELADRQLLEIARALLQRPRVLILDEPTSALQQGEVDRLHDVLRSLRDSGVAILYVSHFLEEVLTIADHLAVLRDGRRVTATLDPATSDVDDLVDAMLGERDRGGAVTGTTATWNGPRQGLTVRGLTLDDRLEVPALDAARGEILGLAGLQGAGAALLLRVLFGLEPGWHGTITLPDGSSLARRTADLVGQGVALVPADRKAVGLMPDRSITDNIVQVQGLAKGAYGPLLRSQHLHAVARAHCDRLGVVHATTEQAVRDLSGGNQQKIVFAKWLEACPEVVLLDDPTRGVDVGAKREMHAIVQGLRDDGVVVVLTSTDLRELAALADRCVIFRDGRPTGELSGDALTEASLLAAINTETITEHRGALT